MNHSMAAMARRFDAANITTESVQDAKGRPCALRFYADGKAFEIRPELVEGERLRLVIDGYEAEETETPESRLEHVLEVIRRSSP